MCFESGSRRFVADLCRFVSRPLWATTLRDYGVFPSDGPYPGAHGDRLMLQRGAAELISAPSWSTSMVLTELNSQFGDLWEDEHVAWGKANGMGARRSPTC